MARHLDDSRQVRGYAKQGALVLKGEAQLLAPGRLDVAGRELTADHVIGVTGSDAAFPTMDGLDTVTTWTNRETYTAHDLPAQAVIVGGSAEGWKPHSS